MNIVKIHATQMSLTQHKMLDEIVLETPRYCVKCSRRSREIIDARSGVCMLPAPLGSGRLQKAWQLWRGPSAPGVTAKCREKGPVGELTLQH